MELTASQCLLLMHYHAASKVVDAQVLSGSDVAVVLYFVHSDYLLGIFYYL